MLYLSLRGMLGDGRHQGSSPAWVLSPSYELMPACHGFVVHTFTACVKM